jgi:hypothetical protein
MNYPLQFPTTTELHERLLGIWKEFRAIPFPPGIGGVRINNHELVWFDASMAGLIQSFINNGHLDPSGTARLGLGYHDLSEMFGVMSHDANRYFVPLHLAAGLTLELIAASGRADSPASQDAAAGTGGENVS